MKWKVFFWVSFVFWPFLAKAETLFLNPVLVKDRVLSNSVLVEKARIYAQSQKLELSKAKSIYDLYLSAEALYRKDKSQKVTTLFGTNNTTTIYNSALAQHTPLGTDLSVNFTNQRETSNSPFVTLSPAHDAKVVFSLNQPLAKNGFGFVERKKIEALKKNLEATDDLTRSQVEALVLEAVYDYWSFYLTQNLIGLDNEATSMAYQLYLTNQKKEDIGLIEKSDLAAFAASYKLAQASLYETKGFHALSTETVRNHLNVSPEVVLVSGKNVKMAPPKNLSLALNTALTHRSDYLALKKQLKASELAVSYTKNNLFPELDVNASLALNGVDGNFSDAASNVGDGHPAWSVGFKLVFPLQNKEAKANYKQAKYEKAQKILELKAKELEIVEQVQGRYKQVQFLTLQVSSLESAAQFQYQKWAGETKKYDQGRSSTDIVIRYQNDYITAKKMALQARVNLNQALVTLAFAEGQILDLK